MAVRVEVRAPCRLHFGMFSFGHADKPQFGGVGAMLDSPPVHVTFAPADKFSIEGPLSNRTEKFIDSALHTWNISEPPRCRVTVDSPPDHVGLGVGTQLGLATATGLRQFLELPAMNAEQLAASVGRGARSAIGTHGFRVGGLLVDAGKLPDESLGELTARVDLPDDWRFVLMRASDTQGFAGKREIDAFANLPPVPLEVTVELWRITESEMLPAVEARDCDAFGEAVYQFGRLAGECFSKAQGGTFASPQAARLIAAIRDRGIRGVGQSSWGPTVFAITPNTAAAESLVEWLRRETPTDTHITISQPNNSGAHITLA